MNIKNMTVGVDVKINMQEYYDQLVLLRKTIDAQIKVLEDSPMICTHKKTEEIGNGGVFICANPYCNHVVSKGTYDWVR